MSRRLKDLYPCDTCQTPVEVRCRREIEHARCRPCSERKRLLSNAAYRMQRANELYEKHRRSATVEQLLEVAPFWLEAAEQALSGCVALTKAAAMASDPAERAKWIRIALTWSKWATSVNDSARSHLAAEGVAVAAPVPTLPEPPKLSAPMMGHLKLILIGGGVA